MSTLKKIFKWLGILVLTMALIAFSLYLIYVRPVLKNMEQMTTINFDKDLTIVLGGGGNSGILVSDSLVVVVDTKMNDGAEEFSKTVAALAGSKPILVVNTHFHPDHSGGNKYYKGQTIVAGGNYTRELWLANADEENMPTEWLKDRMDIKMNDDTITILNMDRNAHTQSDVFVYLHKRKLLFSGDVILNHQIPALVSEAADPYGYLEDFDTLTKQFEIKTVVPGHGPVGGPEVIESFRQYFKDMEIAATDESKRSELVSKYDDWGQVPIVMSPGATIKVLKEKAEDNKE